MRSSPDAATLLEDVQSLLKAHRLDGRQVPKLIDHVFHVAHILLHQDYSLLQLGHIKAMILLDLFIVVIIVIIIVIFIILVIVVIFFSIVIFVFHLTHADMRLNLRSGGSLLSQQCDTLVDAFLTFLDGQSTVHEGGSV